MSTLELSQSGTGPLRMTAETVEPPRLPASIAAGIPVDLRDTATGLDAPNIPLASHRHQPRSRGTAITRRETGGMRQVSSRTSWMLMISCPW